ELVEVRDAADHRGAGDDMVAASRELGQERRILGVAFDQAVPRVVVEGAPDRAVLAEVIDPDHLVAGVQQLGDEVPADESRCASDESFHALSVGLALPGRLTRVAICHQTYLRSN